MGAQRLPDSCDVVVIGAGIGGLVAACDLAKAGAEVVLVERHYQPGGYCSGFTRRGYRFDAAAHSLGSCRPDGQIGRFITDHGILNELRLMRYDPTDIVLTKHHAVEFRTDWAGSLRALQREFPSEWAALRRFVEYIVTTDSLKLFADLSGIRFADLLDRYFEDPELKSVFSMLLANIGLPSSMASAMTAVFLYREFIFDGGYYPRGGMQRFADVLLAQLRAYGGTALLLTPADAIELDASGAVEGVRVRHVGRQAVQIKARTVIANCDPYQLYGRLLADTPAGSAGLDGLQGWLATPSAVMLHLGVRMDLGAVARYRCPLWSYPGGHIDECFERVMAGEMDRGPEGFIFIGVPSFHDSSLAPEGGHVVHAIALAPYRERASWEPERAAVGRELLSRIERYLPGVSEHIEVSHVAIPPTLVKYTGNHLGAMYGWASVPEQVGRRKFSDRTEVDGLYLTGHWTGVPSGNSGIPTVVTAGRAIARSVLAALRRRRYSLLVDC